MTGRAGRSACVDVNEALESTHAADLVQSFDWHAVREELNAYGCARLEGVLAPDECDALVRVYSDDQRFRSRVVMARHGFGRGEYKYFAYPLPGLIHVDVLSRRRCCQRKNTRSALRACAQRQQIEVA